MKKRLLAVILCLSFSAYTQCVKTEKKSTLSSLPNTVVGCKTAIANACEGVKLSRKERWPWSVRGAKRLAVELNRKGSTDLEGWQKAVQALSQNSK